MARTADDGRRSRMRVKLRSLIGALAMASLALTACGDWLPMQPVDGGLGGDAGHGGGGADAGPASDGGLPASLACATLDAARCAFLARCGLVGDDDDAQARCRARLEATWCGPTMWLPRVRSPINTLRYDGRRAQACADAFATRRCEDFDGLPQECGTFLAPAANLKQQCYGDYEECIEGVCRGGACPRSCQPRGVRGDACQRDGDCVTGLYCRQPPGRPSGACTSYGAVGDFCDGTDHCQGDLLCSASQCKATPGLDQPCVDGRCDDNTRCVAGSDGGVCVARLPESAPCGGDECQPGLACLPSSGQCEPERLTALGAPCLAGQVCPTGAACVGWTNEAPGACETLHDEGAPCTRHGDCQPHLACLEVEFADGGPSGRACARRQPVGGDCDDGRACDVQAVCVEGRCVPLPSPDDACGEAGQCLWGACRVTSAEAWCVGLLGPGAACQADDECAGHRCVGGACVAACTP